MRIWLIQVAEPLPIDGENARLLRTGMLADLLASQGHEVVWWTSAFDHFAKVNRCEQAATVEVRGGYEIRLLPGCEYQKNISLQRIRNHRQVAQAFRRESEEATMPDVILCSMPTIELSLAATEYGVNYNVPVVLDLRDLWPDIFTDHAPRWLRPAIQLATRPARRDLAKACRTARGLVSMTDDFLDWGLRYAGRPRNASDRVFPLAYSSRPPSTESLQQAEAFWRAQRVGTDNEFVICFFGNISTRYELHDVIRAAGQLEKQSVKCRFVICGKGEDLANCQQIAAGLNNVTFPGWVGAAEIWTLMRKSNLGIVPYPSSQDFVRNLPNKAIEYLSAGLPVISSLQGELASLLATHNCGLTYENRRVDDLVRAVNDCYDSRENCARMAQNATALFRERFVAETVYGQMSDFLTHLAEEKRRAA